MKKLLFSLILSLLPIASNAIQYEYFNPLMKSNAAVKVNETVGVLTPPEGKGFGVLSALTNMQSVASSIATNEYGIQVDTLGLVCPTEDAVAAAISDHNSSETAHSFIQNKVAVNTAAIDANADAIQKTRDDMNEEDGRLQTQITAHAGAITVLQNEQTATGNQIQTIESKIPDGTSDTNPLINKQQLLDEEMDIREDLNSGLSELQTQITAQAAAIAGKQDELIAGENITIVDNVISATGGGGGSGDYLPLSGGTVQGVVKIQNGQGTGSLWVGADVNNTTLTNNQRHLARIVVPSFTNVERGATLLGWDSSGDVNVPITNNSADIVGFGGSKKITNATSPMGISFCVAKTREATAAADKVYPLAMDANAANFDVPVDVPELTVGTDDGTLNLSITAGVATIATNNGLDIISQTKFDTLPTTDDTTTWANALDANLVSKAQVASALSELPTGANLPILTSIWADHLLNDMSWLRADTFSWQSGDVYKAAYDHLTNDMRTVYAWVQRSGSYGFIVYTESATPSVGDNIYDENGSVIGSCSSFNSGSLGWTGSGGTTYSSWLRSVSDDLPSARTETIGDTTITYYLAQDGHKICLPDQESNVVALYESTGVAWYYILDTENKQFKLPRTKYGFTGLRDSVGGYVEPALPNITGNAWARGPEANSSGSDGALYVTATADTYGRGHSEGSATAQFNLDASRSSTIYKDGATVQPPATQMYLYFYVGNFEQSAVEQTAGINAEMFNDLNAHKIIESQNPTAENGYTWYRKYADGWVEQGGSDFTPRTINAGTGTAWYVTMPVPMSDTNYNIQISFDNGNLVPAVNNNKQTTTTQVYLGCKNQSTGNVTSQVQYWQVSGMFAQ